MEGGPVPLGNAIFMYLGAVLATAYKGDYFYNSVGIGIKVFEGLFHCLLMLFMRRKELDPLCYSCLLYIYTHTLYIYIAYEYILSIIWNIEFYDITLCNY